MTRWEYTHLELWRGAQVDDIGDFLDEVARLGNEGWEMVGEVRPAYNPRGTVASNTTYTPLLKFKRPVVG